jgi:hypothetical protein
MPAPHATRRLLVVANARDERPVNAGVRNWFQREKLAFDLSWQCVRAEEGRASGIVVCFGFYDL